MVSLGSHFCETNQPIFAQEFNLTNTCTFNKYISLFFFFLKLLIELALSVFHQYKFRITSNFQCFLRGGKTTSLMPIENREAK